MSRRVFGFIPVAVKVTDDLPEGSAGQAHGLTVYVRSGYENDEGLIQHEIEHIRQWLRLLWVFDALLWAFVPDYSRWCEARAYIVQTQYPDANGVYLTLEGAAERLARPLYAFGWTQAEALEYLKGLQ